MKRGVWLGLAMLVVAAGCSNGAPDVEESQESQGQDISSAPTFPNDKAAFDYFLAKGLKNYQAAGIVGNLDQESGMNPAIAQLGGGPGRGIAQWSTGGRWDEDKNDNAVAFAAQEKKDVKSLSLQLDFIWHELTSFPSYGLAELESSKNVHDAVTAFQDRFEACGDCVATNRVNYAQHALDAYGGDKVAVNDAGTTRAKTSDAGDAGDATEAPDAGDIETPSPATTTSDGNDDANGRIASDPSTGGEASSPLPDPTPSGGCSVPSAMGGDAGWLIGLALVLLRRKRGSRRDP